MFTSEEIELSRKEEQSFFRNISVSEMLVGHFRKKITIQNDETVMKTIKKNELNNKKDRKLHEISLRDFQELIRKMYYEKDRERGAAGTFLWLIEEVGELASAIRNGTKEELRGEFADVLAWLTTIANVLEIDLTQSVLEKYGSGCPGCGKYLCQCPDNRKP